MTARLKHTLKHVDDVELLQFRQKLSAATFMDDGFEQLQSQQRDDDILHDLQVMRRHATMSLEDLTGEAQVAFQRLKHLVQNIYETPDRYALFYRLLNEAFGDFETIYIHPGTLGAYFAGCLKEPDGCGFLCSTALPLPTETQEISSLCPHIVLIATDNNNMHPGDIWLFHKATNGLTDPIVPQRAVIYFNGATRFEGFSLTEIQVLQQQFHIEWVQLIATSNTWQTLDSLPIRKSTTSGTTGGTTRHWASYLLLFLALLIMICAAAKLGQL